MKITFILLGKTSFQFIQDGIELYKKRLSMFISFELKVIPELKKMKFSSENHQKEIECKHIEKYINKSASVVLLDEHGKRYTSLEFARFIEKKMIVSTREMVFIVGGAYGFSDSFLKNPSYSKMSLSDMTFSHQIIRLIFMEQLYRAISIINGTPYHHE